MTTNNFHDVGVFHEKFRLDNVLAGGVGPRDLPPGLLEFRIKFMLEELQEFVDAYTENPRENHAKMADALVDLVYVAMGTAHLLGYPWQVIWDAVQKANMAKVRAESAQDSKRGSAFDVVKPPGWRPPDVAGILRSMGWDA